MPLPPFTLERYLTQPGSLTAVPLSASDLEPYRLHEVLALADDETRELWESLTLGYASPSGHPLLRAEIARLYADVREDEVLTFGGADEAIFVVLHALLGPDDHAVVAWPGYQSLYALARSAGAAVTLLPLRVEQGWSLDVEELRRAIRPTTRAIILNFPHNPTGALLARDTFAAVVEVASEVGAWLISDEVYRLLEFAPDERLPAAVDTGAQGISIGVMSKPYALAGLRIGWIATHDQALLNRCGQVKAYTSTCNSAPSEILSVMALRAQPQILARNAELITRNLTYLDTFFSNWTGIFDWVRPRGGTVAFPRVAARLPVDQLARELLEAENVLIVPAAVYDYPGNHFRIGFGRVNLPDALGGLERFVLKRL